MPNTTPQAALLSDAAKLADELDHEASKRACNVAMMPASLPVDAAKELRRLDALVAHLTADRDDTANELALRTKHNLALTNERDQLLAKLQATQEPVQAGELPDEREAFEQFAQNCPMGKYNITRREDGYDSSHTQIMWDAWQARVALSARKPLTRQELREAFHRETRCTLGGDIHLAERVCAVVERAHGIGLEVKP